jgi:hypothetical protein
LDVYLVPAGNIVELAERDAWRVTFLDYQPKAIAQVAMSISIYWAA